MLTPRLLFTHLLFGCLLILSGCAHPPENGRDKLLNLAHTMALQGDAATAVRLYQRAVMEGDSSPEVLAALGENQLAIHDYAGACQTLNMALAQRADDQQLRYQKGVCSLFLGDATAADWLASSAPQVGTATAFTRLGYAQLLRGRIKEAVTAFNRASQLVPGNPNMLSNLALAEALEGNSFGARQASLAAVQAPAAQPSHARNFLLVAALLHQNPDEIALPLNADERQQAWRQATVLAAQGRSPADRARMIGRLSAQTR